MTLTYPIRSILAACLLITFSSSKCEKEETPIPACIQQKIDSIKQTPKSSPPAQVHSWLYRGTTVYLFSATEPNQLVTVWNESCQYICAPSGGVSGGGDSTCTDFFQEAQHTGVIWQDTR